MTQALQRTPLYSTHVSLKAKMVPFAGWEMPVQFTSILSEARAVRSKAGLFDVSHMGRLYISGPQASDVLDWILTADASKLGLGRARYALICNQKGGIIDDGVFYRLAKDRYLLVCNAANRETVLSWITGWAREKFPQTTIEDHTMVTTMIAFQGPATPEVLDSLCDKAPSSTRTFSAMETQIAGKSAFIGRTGYTGEDGFELILKAEEGPEVWETLIEKGAPPCGLGARDVLRLEAGLMLHGNDIDASTTPLEADLERFVRLEKEFFGADVMRHQKEVGIKRRLVGLFIMGNNIARKGYPILAQGEQVGQITSGTYSPTLDRSIAMGYVSMEYTTPGQRLQVDIRGKTVEAEVVQLPFYSRKRRL